VGHFSVYFDDTRPKKKILFFVFSDSVENHIAEKRRNIYPYAERE
jgi:hypothetical protein